MDIEKGSTSLLPTTSSSNITLKLLVAVPIVISCLALAGTLALIVQNQQMQADMNHLTSQDSTQNPDNSQIPDLAEQERALREVKAHLNELDRSTRGTTTSTNVACEDARIRTDCSSERTSNSTEIPSAHIVPSGSPYVDCTIQAPNPLRFYTIISSGWTCGARNIHGHVRGGMVFDRQQGTLTVPVEGIYFVYSQVHINMTHAPDNVFSGHQTFICEDSNSCRPSAYLVSRALTDVTIGAYYHGGLFHLSAGSEIMVVSWYDRAIRAAHGSIAYQATFPNTFFGAFLVEEIQNSASPAV